MVCASTRVTKISETDFFKVFRDKTILIKDFCLLSIFYFYMFCILTIKIKKVIQESFLFKSIKNKHDTIIVQLFRHFVDH
jgi:predicted transglutaminase-like protease